MHSSSLGLSLYSRCLHRALCSKWNHSLINYWHFRRLYLWIYAFLTIPPKNHNLYTVPVFILWGFFLPRPPRPKDTAVSGVRTWLWFGFSKAMSRAGLLSPPQWASEWSGCPHMCSVGPALPTLLIAGDVLDSVQLTSTRLDASLSEEGPLETRPEFVNKNTLDTRVWAA